MAALGSAKTNRFMIGTAELRVGAMSAAAKLTQAHSVGLIDNASVNYSRETAQLVGGFPQKVVDETPKAENTTITATMREYSRRNLGIMLGQGTLTDAADVITTASGVMTGAAAAPVLPTATTTGFMAGDTCVAYVVGQPELVAVVVIGTVTASTSIALGAMDSDLFTAINAAVTAGRTLKLFKAALISVGNLSQTEYMAVSLVQKDLKTGRPIVFNFWKCSVQGGLDYGTNADDYASTELTLNVLEPAASEYGAGQPLEHLAAIIPTCPMWQLVRAQDAAT